MNIFFHHVTKMPTTAKGTFIYLVTMKTIFLGEQSTHFLESVVFNLSFA
jgi:hypothetical protein